MASENPQRKTTRREYGAAATPSMWRPAWVARLLPDGIRERLFLLIALALVPILILEGWIYYQHHTVRRNEAMQTEREVAQGVATAFTGYLNDVHRQLHTAGQAIVTFAPYTEAKAEYLLGTIVDQYPTVLNVSWVSPRGIVLASSLPALVGGDLSGRDYFQQILAGQSWALGDLMPAGTVTETPIFVIASAIRDGPDELRGLVVAAIEPKRLGVRTFAAERPASGAYSIFDRQGRLIYRNPEISLTWEQRGRWRQADPLLQGAREGRIAQGTITCPLAGDRRIAARAPIPGIDWVVGASRPVRVAMGPVWLALVQEATVGLLVTLLAFIAAYVIARTIADPLRRLEAEAQALGEGRIEPPAEPYGPKEVRHLRDTMAAMATDLIQRAEALRQSERRFRKLFEADLMGAYVTRPDGTLLDCNDKMMTMLGYDSREEFLGHRSTDFYVDPAFRDEAVRVLLRDGIFPGREGLLRRKDGEVIHALGFAVLLRDEQTGQTYIQGVAVDVTERKRAEEALRESEAKFRSVFEQAAIGMGRVCLATARWIDVNDTFCRMLGYTPEEMQATPWPEITYPEDVDLDLIPFRRMAAGELDNYTVEKRFIHKEGRHVWARLTLSLVRDAEDRPEYEIAIIEDITDRKQVEEMLKQHNVFLNSVLESLTHPFYVVDASSYEIVMANSATGLTDRPSRVKCHVATHNVSTPCPEAGAEHPCPLEQVKRTGRPTVLEHVHYDRRGNRRNVEVHAYPIFDEQGNVTQMIEYCLDVTERKQAEEALRDLTKTLESRVAARTAELEQRTRQLQKLALELAQAEERERKRVAEILHDELQQQLAAAKFHLGLLGTQIKGNAALQEAVTPIEAMLKEAIAKSRSLSHELSPAALYHGDFGEAFEWLASQVQTKHGLTVHTDVHGPIELSSDAIKAFLFRTTQEILFNIVKHAQVNEARMRLRRRRGRLWLTVCDKGQGFDPRSLGQVGGFGLLSIRERIELLGGRMKIRSAPGRGSTFLIAVPEGPVAEGGGQKIEDGVSPPAVAALRVLLADDHKLVREGLATLLNEQEDIEVVGQAANGHEAVALAHELKPDVVVMDVSMPLMEGDEATRRIKRDAPGTRVVGLSMFEEPALTERMHRAGAEHYVIKTAPAAQLLAAIRNERAEASP